MPTTLHVTRKTNGRKNIRYNGHYTENGNGSHGFNLATIVQVGLIPLLSGGIYLAAQWVTQGDELKRHEQAIDTNIPQQFKQEAEARERTRAEFLDKLGKLNDNLNLLNTHIAVQDEQQKTIATTLGQIRDQLVSKGR